MFKAKLYANIIADQELPFDLTYRQVLEKCVLKLMLPHRTKKTISNKYSNYM